MMSAAEEKVLSLTREVAASKRESRMKMVG